MRTLATVGMKTIIQGTEKTENLCTELYKGKRAKTLVNARKRCITVKNDSRSWMCGSLGEEKEQDVLSISLSRGMCQIKTIT
jgi:hypothetical protein